MDVENQARNVSSSALLVLPAAWSLYVLPLAVGLSFLVKDALHQQTGYFRQCEQVLFCSHQVHQHQSVC